MPNKITIKRRYKRRSRCQKGKEIGKVFNLIKKVAESPVAKEIGRLTTVKSLHKVDNKDVNKIKNKRVKNALQYNLSNSVLGMGTVTHMINYSKLLIWV